jgi:hypothetical protein
MTKPIIIIINLIYTKGKISELNPPVAIVLPVEVIQPQESMPGRGPVFFTKQAVTVIKPAQKKQAKRLPRFGQMRYNSGSVNDLRVSHS